jgi:beta propeller repeat protein
MAKLPKIWEITNIILKSLILFADLSHMHTLYHNYQRIRTVLVISKASRISMFTLSSIFLLITAATVLPFFGAPLSNSITAFAQTSVTGTETQVTSDDGPQFNSQISGDNIVYTDSSTGEADIYYYNIQSDSFHPVSDAPGDQQISDISDSYIVYTDYATGSGDIWLYEIATETLTNITSNPADQSYPAISDQIVAWEDSRDVDRDIWIYDISTQEYRDITGAGNQDSPAVSGDRVVYRDTEEPVSLKLYDASSDTTTTIFQGTSDNAPDYPSIDGDFVTFAIGSFSSSGADIAVYNINTEETTVLTIEGTLDVNPNISGDWVSFEQFDSSTGSDSHIVLWHWTVGSNPETDTFLITPTTSHQALNDIDGNRVTYSDNRNSNLDIFVYEFTEEESPPPVTTYTIDGFYAPIDPPPEFNLVSSGRTLPFKFNVYEVSADGTTRTEITDTSIVKSFEVVRDVSRAECNNADVDAAEETTTTSTSLVYDTQGGHFVQYWKLTPRTTYPSNSCWTATLTVGDDVSTATKEALIKIR